MRATVFGVREIRLSMQQGVTSGLVLYLLGLTHAERLTTDNLQRIVENKYLLDP